MPILWKNHSWYIQHENNQIVIWEFTVTADCTHVCHVVHLRCNN